jgi:hypothetical protein
MVDILLLRAVGSERRAWEYRRSDRHESNEDRCEPPYHHYLRVDEPDQSSVLDAPDAPLNDWTTWAAR